MKSTPSARDPLRLATHLRDICSYEEFDAMLDQQIQENRKGDLELTLLDPFGKPVAGNEISLTQTDHEFTFGVCPNGHLGMTNTLANGDGPESENYWELIGELFNATTLWWGWRVLEPKKGEWTFDQRVNDPTNHYWAEQGPMERMVQRAEALGHDITAHGILYPRKDVSPEWIQACDPKEATELLERHVRTVARRYKDRVKVWHPVNEAYDEIQTVGNLQVNEGAVYKWIQEEAPHGLIVNNGGYEIHPDFYKQGIDNAARFNARVDACGIRGYHYLYRINDLESQKRRWNHFNDLVQHYGIGLKYTEIGVNSELHDVAASEFISGNAPHEGVVTIELKDGGESADERRGAEHIHAPDVTTRLCPPRYE